MSRLLTAATVTLGMFVSACYADNDFSDPWPYIARAEHRPAARSISLSEDVPPDFQQDVRYRGTQRRYAQLRYGSENSRRVVIVVDELGDKEFDIYADLNRDRELTSDELIEGHGRGRRFSLPTEIIREDQADQSDRRIELKVGITGKRLSVATVGFIEGTISGIAIDIKKPLLVRRVDGNANGLFADARDRLLLDLDGDGNWNPISEQFAYLPILKIKDRRYAVRSDRLGTNLSLSEIKGIGNLRVSVAALPPETNMLTFEAMVFSNDGSAYSLKSLDQVLAVPVGKYLLGSVTMTLDTGEKSPWHFVFSRNQKISDDQWVRVAAGAEVALEAIGKTQFQLGVDRQGSFHPGRNVRISPSLYTERGLLINLCSRGRTMGSFDRERFHNPCEIKMTDGEGSTIGSAKSGFA